MPTATPVRATHPAYRPYRTQVVDTTRLSPSFLRVTLTGEDLVHFGTEGLDQRVTLVLPLPLGADGAPGFGDFGLDDPETLAEGTWYRRWRELPERERNPIRTYTVRRIDAHRRLLDIDVVVHDPAGPASAWALGARPGDEVVVVGPDSRSPESGVGISLRPRGARHLLLVGDETALPAIAAILERAGTSRPPASLHAVIEVPTAADVLPLAVPPGATVSWAAREWFPAHEGGTPGVAAGRPGATGHGATLLPRVREWIGANRDLVEAQRVPGDQDLPDVDVDTELLWDDAEGPRRGDLHAWVAGEAAAVRGIRRHLVGECGIARSQVAFMGYWRLGRTGAL